MSIVADILRKMLRKNIRVTYTNGMTVDGQLDTFDLEYGILTISNGRDDTVVMLNGVRHIRLVT